MNIMEIKDTLKIPSEYIIPYAIILGYPDEEPKEKKLKSMDEIRI